MFQSVVPHANSSENACCSRRSDCQSGSEKKGRRPIARPMRSFPCVLMPIETSSSGRSTGSDRRRMAFTNWKIAAFAPVPSANVRMATSENVRCFRSTRTA
jgi:hypothetical protein